MAPGALDCVNEQKTNQRRKSASEVRRTKRVLETVRCSHEENPSPRSQRKNYKHPTPRRRSANGGITSDITRAGTTYFRSPFEPLCGPQSIGITAPLEPGNNAQLWTPPRHQNIAMRCLELTMGDPQIAKLILAVLAVGMVVGFVAGYAIRAAISHHRHIMARRSRVIGGR